MSVSLAGVLSRYPLPHSTWQQRPYFTSGDLSSDRAILFIGGLYSGLLDAPYLPRLSDALTESKWRLIQIYWSGCYDGFGTGSLDRDRDEMAALVRHLRAQGLKTIVLMGHSTGCQGVIHYLSTSTEPTVDGGILQAPASDREFFEKGRDDTWAPALAAAEKLIKEGKKEDLLDATFTEALGARMTAYRLHSLIAVGGDDDYFSSDLPDIPDSSPHIHPLSTSFGAVSAPVLAVWSENDHCAILPDQRLLLRRWEKASRGKLEWRVLENASHGVEEAAAQKVLCKDVVEWLAKTFT